ncbi:MAG: ABC transporter ATP-binding protein [Bacteroidales bacterium]|jgi:iron complex transport system ATP-binding protein|nr:ABC transporter ATP-binding protein [Bacteroidales bacterium]
MIEVKHLTYKANRHKILLNDVSLCLEDGGFYGIIGNNGSGKTTLLRCMSGTLNTKSDGSITINGKDIASYSARQLAKQIAVVPQHTDILFDFSAHQIVMMGRFASQKRWLMADSEEDLAKVERAMRQTGTWDLRNTSVKVLSGGELQRIIIARALVQDTPFILLDEPISSLDIKHQQEIMNLLTQINRLEHRTIVVILHDLNLALAHTQHLFVLNGGSLVAKGDTKNILSPLNIRRFFGVDAQIITDESLKPHIIFN